MENNFQLTYPLDYQSRKIIKDLVAFPVPVQLKNTEPATAANYGVFFTAPKDKSYAVASVSEIHGTKGTDGSAVTLQIERLQGTEALDSGDEILATAFDLKGADNTVQYGILKQTDVTVVQNGNRLALKDAGTPTSVANLQVTVWLIEL